LVETMRAIETQEIREAIEGGNRLADAHEVGSHKSTVFHEVPAAPRVRSLQLFRMSSGVARTRLCPRPPGRRRSATAC